MLDLQRALEVRPQFGEVLGEHEGQLPVAEDEALGLAPGRFPCRSPPTPSAVPTLLIGAPAAQPQPQLPISIRNGARFRRAFPKRNTSQPEVEPGPRNGPIWPPLAGVRAQVSIVG